MTGDVRLEAAAPGDLPAIAECVRRFRLDDEDLAAEQFVVARERGRLVAFGRIKPYRIVRELARRFPTREVYLTTDLPAYFARFGFCRIDDPPPEIAAKIAGVCAHLRSGVVAMLLEKPD